MIKHNFAILECKGCHYRAAVAIGSKRQIKDKVKDGMVVCSKCEGRRVVILDALERPHPERTGLEEVFLGWSRANAAEKGQ